MDIARIAKAVGRLELVGAPEGFDALVTADLARAHQGVTLFAARDGARADDFAGALAFFAPALKVMRFPSWDCLPYDRVGPSPGVAAQRMAALWALAHRDPAEREPLVVIATVPSLVQRTPPQCRSGASSPSAAG